MPSIYDVQINQRFSFDVFPTAVIGNNFRDVRLEGIINARTAAAYGFDVEAMHQAVYPSLPQGVPNDPYGYGYIRIQYPNGSFDVVGIPWIRQETIQISTGGQVTMTFENATQADLDRMLNALSANGFRPNDVRVSA